MLSLAMQMTFMTAAALESPRDKAALFCPTFDAD